MIIQTKYAELIVRYAELKAMGLEQNLLDSFNGLVEFHHEYATPLVKQEIAFFQQEYCGGNNASFCIVDLN